VYGQCGGSGWSGATACNTQATCNSMNPYYSQCVPTAA
jgi:endoglucanase